MSIIAYDVNGIMVSRTRERVRMTARFVFETADAAAVLIILKLDGEQDSPWTVSREVLHRAVIKYERAGDGLFFAESAFDVYAGDLVLLHMRDDQGCAHFLFAQRTLARFIADTVLAVPLGEEVYDMDSVIERMLS